MAFFPRWAGITAGRLVDIRGLNVEGLVKDRSFNVDVPPKSSVTLTVSNAGSFPYYCTYHPDQHNEASINVS